MYPGEEPSPPHHHHHLPKIMDDDDDDDNHHDEHDHHTPYPPPPGEGQHHQPPPATPQQPLQPPKQLFSPQSRPPSKKRSTPTATPPPPQMSLPPPQQPLQPPQMTTPPTQQPLQPPQMIIPPPQQPLQPSQPIFLPTSPPPKPGPPPPHDGDEDNPYNDGNNRHQQVFAVITILLLLIGLTALILWLLYRPSKPHFTAVSAAVYFLNTTSPPTYITTSMQLTVLTRNPSKRTSLHYDHLTVTLHYRNYPITPPAALPPLHQRKRSTIMMSPVIGGGPAVAVPPEVAEGIANDEAYGIVGLSWVLVGRVKYRAGWYRSGHNRVYVRCDVMLGFKNGGGVNGNGNNPSVPLLGNPPCFVEM